MRKGIYSLCLLLAVFLTGPASATELSEVSSLARTGATELALGLMDRHQPALEEDPVAWMRWERERLHLYRGRQLWAAMDERVAGYPDHAPVEFSRWARTQQVQALLALGRPEDARTVLRRLIWSAESLPEAHFRAWRQLIIESQLEAGDADAARIALRRFRQDYQDNDGETRVIEARLYLQEGQGIDAMRALQELPQDQYRPLRLLAHLQLDPDAAGEVLTRAIELGFDNEAAIADRRMAWSVASLAARETGNRSARVGALERGLGHRSDESRADPIFRLRPDMLWEAYHEYGRQLGNEARILVGDDPMWFELAESYAVEEPVKARAVLSVTAFRSFEEAARAQAHEWLVDSLSGERHGPDLIRRLYLESDHFPAIEDIPLPVRYRLADLALNEADIPLASQLMSELTEPPQGADAQDWGLRRARVLLLGGQREEGLLALERVLLDTDAESGDEEDGVDTLEVGRFLQVVFDLQNMNDHEPAMDFLRRLMDRDLEGQQHREILFWAAESAEGMDDPVEAARLYLRSAGFHDAFSMDQWAQTARYRAADALADAGMTEDAQRLYRSLLNATDEEARRAVLRNRIQRLQIMSTEVGSDASEP